MYVAVRDLADVARKLGWKRVADAWDERATHYPPPDPLDALLSKKP